MGQTIGQRKLRRQYLQNSSGNQKFPRIQRSLFVQNKRSLLLPARKLTRSMHFRIKFILSLAKFSSCALLQAGISSQKLGNFSDQRLLVSNQDLISLGEQQWTNELTYHLPTYSKLLRTLTDKGEGVRPSLTNTCSSSVLINLSRKSFHRLEKLENKLSLLKNLELRSFQKKHIHHVTSKEKQTLRR